MALLEAPEGLSFDIHNWDWIVSDAKAILDVHRGYLEARSNEGLKTKNSILDELEYTMKLM